MKIGMQAAALMALCSAAMRFRAVPQRTVKSWRTDSFKQRDTKKHFSRSARNVKYKAQRAANRLRRKIEAAQ